VGEEGFKRVKEHPWFKEIDWNKLELKQLQPPFLPDVREPADTILEISTNSIRS
jgi:hypothetical protein